MKKKMPISRSMEEVMYPEFFAGSFSARDCTVAFYTRIDAVLERNAVVANIGAGRGANILADPSPYRRKIQTFSGRVGKVIGIDIDAAIVNNPDLDEAHLISAGSSYPIPDNSVDVIISDHVLEHVEDTESFVREIGRILKPGGWFCARTPTKWGYIGLGARLFPNALHVRLLSKLQPGRYAEDVFPTEYNMNTMKALKRAFPENDWQHCTYGFNGVPGYHANNVFLFKLIEWWGFIMPRALSAKFHVFLRKR
jgi:SAM-dependent methyltransferase